MAAVALMLLLFTGWAEAWIVGAVHARPARVSCAHRSHLPSIVSRDYLLDSFRSSDVCLLPEYFEEDQIASLEENALKRFRITISLVPIIAPILALLGYDATVDVFHDLVKLSNTWYSVDGGAAEAQLITPLINGVVQPAVSVVLGTLVASTLTQLRNRQINIRASLNKEASDIRMLDAAINALFPLDTEANTESRRTYLGALRQYVSRILIESTFQQEGGVGKASETELDGILRGMLSSGQEPGARNENSRGDTERFYDPIRFQVPALIQGMNHQRSQRLAEIQTSYPTVHWVILSLLALSIVINFLIESDQAALQFLDSLQLRLIFAIIIGVCTAAASLCIDLNDPFRGNFRITASLDQLYVIRETLVEEYEQSGGETCRISLAEDKERRSREQERQRQAEVIKASRHLW
jgi:hypothetical protein